MAKLKFDETGKKYFSAGVNEVVLSVYDAAVETDDNGKYNTPVAWDGITSIANSPEGGEATKLYADNTKYLELMSAEKLGGTIEAYQAPKEFNKCDGKADGLYNNAGIPGMVVGAQSRIMFGFAYITRKGNDVNGTDYGRVLHIVYGAKVSPSEASYETINDSPDAITFSWSYSCTPIGASEHGISGVTKPIYTIEVAEKLKDGSTNEHFEDLIDYIYGTDGDGSTAGTDPLFPLPAKVYSILSAS